MSGPAAEPRLGGLHHVTAICGDPQRNLDFYSGVLGLRLVKTTVNFDDPDSYHLYYGDAVGSPGTLLTFFAWSALPPLASGHGRRGTGAIVAISLAIPAASLDFWIERLVAAGVDFTGPVERFGAPVLAFTDPDGVTLELIATEGEGDEPSRPWTDGPVPVADAIRCVHGVTLCLPDVDATAELFTTALGFAEPERVEEVDGTRLAFRFADGAPGTADILLRPHGDPSRMGIGMVHHAAWRTPSGRDQLAWRIRLARAGVAATPVLDRRYFESIYFHEPGGVELEIATDPPGFGVDEPETELGTGLMLPPWLEARRAAITARLPELRPPRSLR